MEDLKYMSFDTKDIDFIDTCEYINIKIGKKEFDIRITEEEGRKILDLNPNISDGHYDTVTIIGALKKLTKFLELSIDIGFSKNLVE